MIIDKRMKFIEQIDSIDYYLFTPSLFRPYFDCRADDAIQRHSLSHLIHMRIYIIGGGYRILYFTINDEVISYIVFTKCKKWIVSCCENKDYYTIFLWTYPNYRNKGLASKMTRYMLDNLNLQYKKFYKTILKSNYSSIAVAEKNGFERISEAVKIGKLHKIVPKEIGDCYLYMYENR